MSDFIKTTNFEKYGFTVGGSRSFPTIIKNSMAVASIGVDSVAFLRDNVALHLTAVSDDRLIIGGNLVHAQVDLFINTSVNFEIKGNLKKVRLVVSAEMENNSNTIKFVTRDNVGLTLLNYSHNSEIEMYDSSTITFRDLPNETTMCMFDNSAIKVDAMDLIPQQVMLNILAYDNTSINVTKMSAYSEQAKLNLKASLYDKARLITSRSARLIEEPILHGNAMHIEEDY